MKTVNKYASANDRDKGNEACFSSFLTFPLIDPCLDTRSYWNFSEINELVMPEIVRYRPLIGTMRPDAGYDKSRALRLPSSPRSV